MQCAMLASGSAGNSLFLASPNTRILLDAGLSCRRLVMRLETLGVSADTIDAIVLTHEHGDHIRGVSVFSRRFKVPVYANRGTFKHGRKGLGLLFQKQEFETGDSFMVGDLTFHPFSISHDAADPVGFTICNDGFRFAVAQDLGIATRLVRHHLRNADGLLLECNHDPEMLISGPYPWSLKERIRSRYGHLSNYDAANLLREVISTRLQCLFLGHLSERNNHPMLVEDAVEAVLGEKKCRHLVRQIGRPDEPGSMVAMGDI